MLLHLFKSSITKHINIIIIIVIGIPKQHIDTNYDFKYQNTVFRHYFNLFKQLIEYLDTFWIIIFIVIHWKLGICILFDKTMHDSNTFVWNNIAVH